MREDLQAGVLVSYMRATHKMTYNYAGKLERETTLKRSVAIITKTPRSPSGMYQLVGFNGQKHPSVYAHNFDAKPVRFGGMLWQDGKTAFRAVPSTSWVPKERTGESLAKRTSAEDFALASVGYGR